MIPPLILTRLWWGLGFMFVGLAVYVCLLPGEELPMAFNFNDKLSHLAGHGALAAYFTGLVARRSWWKILLGLLALGIAIEIAQYFMHAGRHGDPTDVIANSCGALLGLLLGWLGLSRWTQWMAWLLGQRRAVP
ncbi:MAG: VanZ family protein [Pseudomonadota bacterium]